MGSLSEGKDEGEACTAGFVKMRVIDKRAGEEESRILHQAEWGHDSPRRWGQGLAWGQAARGLSSSESSDLKKILSGMESPLSREVLP